MSDSEDGLLIQMVDSRANVVSSFPAVDVSTAFQMTLAVARTAQILPIGSDHNLYQQNPDTEASDHLRLSVAPN